MNRVEVRQALKALIDSNPRSNKKSLEAVSTGYRVYLTLFTADERAQVLTYAQTEHAKYPMGANYPTTFDEAVSYFGANGVQRALGELQS